MSGAQAPFAWEGYPPDPLTSSIFSPSSGLKRLHALTTQAAYELHVDLEDFDNGTAYAHYGSFGVGLFSVDPEEDGYPLTVADYSGTAGEAHGAAGSAGQRAKPLGPRGSGSRPPVLLGQEAGRRVEAAGTQNSQRVRTWLGVGR